MDWLDRMNDIVDYVENNLSEDMDYTRLASMVGCSVYEFSRIFSFITGMPVSEYIRKRRLSQAAFDICSSNDKIIDIALKYCYESQAAFARAFREIHGKTPIEARLLGTRLKTYPKLSFQLTIKGVNQMNYRIIRKETFSVVGLKGNATRMPEGNDTLDPIWRKFMDNYNTRLYSGDGLGNYYHEPLWQVGAYQFESVMGETPCIVGAELDDRPILEGMEVEIVEGSTWAIFEIVGLADKKAANGFDETYAKIFTEWFPSSNYIRNKKIQSLEVFGPGDATEDDYIWEIWMPIIEK